MCRQRLIVLKFGGSVLRDERQLRRAGHEIHRWRRDGWSVVAVVSAFAGRTDALIAAARAASPRAGDHHVAAAAAAGELESATALALGLDRHGIPARVVTPASARLVATGDPLDASPQSIDPVPIQVGLGAGDVVIVPGYAGVDPDGRTVVLGRGGSDLTALVLADALDADRCRLVKDVDGLYVADPSRPGPKPRRYVDATWEDALTTDGSIVQHAAVRFARDRNRPFELGASGSTDPTWIGAGRTARRPAAPAPPVRRVALLGLGTVGRGVLDLLGGLPDTFEVVVAAVRDPGKHAALADEHGFELVTDPAEAAARPDVDLVVEAIGGVEAASRPIRVALARGATVVTANKAVLAAHGARLRDLARETGGRLLASASVGGVTPVLERVVAAPTARVRAVLNGTANFVLGATAQLGSREAAIERARSLGLSEADPSRDLDGRDALDKLEVLAAAAKQDVVYRRRSRCGDSDGDSDAGNVRRQVATLERGAAIVRVEIVRPGDPLHDLPDEWNAAIIERTDGSTEVWRGRGAGRWPTAESIVGDLLEVVRDETDRVRHAAADSASSVPAAAPNS